MTKITTYNPKPSWLTQEIEEEDLLRDLLADKRSPATRREYEKDLKYFFRFLTGEDPAPELVSQFLGLSKADAIQVVLKYKAHLLKKGLKEATVNRRMAAIKSLATYARKIDKCNFTLEEIKGEKITPYRDTSGINPEQFQRLLAVPDRTTYKGKRDYALLKLLWSNALRRSEALVKVKDFDPDSGTLTIIGKGRGTQAEKVSLPPSTVEAIQEWLRCRTKLSPSSPLFIALDRAHYGSPLTGGGVYGIVSAIAKLAGITKVFSPHRIRHSIITAVLDETGGNVAKVQKLSRHKNVGTLLIYNDNRSNDQKEMSDIASKLV